MEHNYKSREYFAPIVNSLLTIKADFERFEIAGSWRRGVEKIKDIDVVCVAPNTDKIAAWVAKYGHIKSGLTTNITAIVTCTYVNWCDKVEATGQVDFKIVQTLEEWPSALLHFTGSKEENIRMRAAAKQRGWLLNEFGLWLAGQPNERVEANSEEEIYAALGMNFKKPHERR